VSFIMWKGDFYLRSPQWD